MLSSRTPLRPSAGRLRINLAANVANFGLATIVGLWMTPYLIRHLGVAAYGLIPLASSFVIYLGLFTLAINAAVGRSLTIALERGDARSANRTFNTSLAGGAVLVLLLAWPLAWGAMRPATFINLPPGLARDARWLLLSMEALFAVATIAAPIESVSYSRNRFDLRTAAAAAGLITRAAALVLLFTYCDPRLWHFGLASVAGAAVALAGAIATWKALAPELRIAPSRVDRLELKALFGTGGWVVVNQTGAILFLNSELILVNRLLGTEHGGRYGAALLWPTLLRTFAGVIAAAFGPPILALYANRDREGLVLYLKRAVNYLGLLVALPVGIVCGLSSEVLGLWLGRGFAADGPLLSLMTAHLGVNLAVFPMFAIQLAANRVRWPAIVTLGMGLLNLALAVALTRGADLGMFGVAAAGAVTLTLKNAIFTPVYCARILELPLLSLLPSIGRTCTAATFVTALAMSMRYLFPLHTAPKLIIAVLFLSGLYALALAFLLGRRRLELAREFVGAAKAER